MKVFMYETHDYIDMYPEKGLRTFKDEATAKAWCKYMNDNYSGGTTRYIKQLTKDEVIAESKSSYWRGYEKDILNLLDECDYED